jgi:hypothetical protein
VRSVFVFPLAELDDVRRRLTRLAREEHDNDWTIGAVDSTDPAPYVLIDSTYDKSAPLYCDWDSSEMQSLEAALGQLPTWSVVCDVSGRISGDLEIRSLVLELLADGGVALDDYSEHCWTATEIAQDLQHDGLRFFDYPTSFERDRKFTGQ